MRLTQTIYDLAFGEPAMDPQPVEQMACRSY